MPDISLADRDFGDRVRAHRESETNAKRARRNRRQKEEEEKLNDELTDEELKQRQRMNDFRLKLMNAGR